MTAFTGLKDQALGSVWFSIIAAVTVDCNVIVYMTYGLDAHLAINPTVGSLNGLELRKWGQNPECSVEALWFVVQACTNGTTLKN